MSSSGFSVNIATLVGVVFAGVLIAPIILRSTTGWRVVVPPTTVNPVTPLTPKVVETRPVKSGSAPEIEPEIETSIVAHKDYGHPFTSALSLTPTYFYNAYRKEQGLDKLLFTFEKMHRESPERCTFRHGLQPEHLTQPIQGFCMKPAHFQLPERLVTLDQFLCPSPNVRTDAQYAFVPPNIPFFPYVHILNFFALCDFVCARSCEHYCEHTEFRPERIFNRSLVYWQLVTGDLAILRRALPKIKASFFLMGHEIDMINLPDWLLEEPKILKIFAVNVPIEWTHRHPKIIPLPLGISKAISKKMNILSDARAKSCSTNATKWVSTKFDIGKKGSLRYHRRKNLLQALRSNGLGYVANQALAMVPLGDFFNHVLEHKTFISPPGMGLDAFRTWEVLEVGRVPIVPPRLHPFLFTTLPVIQMEGGNMSVKTISQEWAALRRNVSRKYNVAKAYMPFWITYILLECLAVP